MIVADMAAKRINMPVTRLIIATAALMLLTGKYINISSIMFIRISFVIYHQYPLLPPPVQCKRDVVERNFLEILW